MELGRRPGRRPVTLAALALAAHLTGRFDNPTLYPPAKVSLPDPAAAHLRYPRGACTDRGGPFGVPVARLAELAGFAYPRATVIKVARAAATPVRVAVEAALGGAPVDDVVALCAEQNPSPIAAAPTTLTVERSARVPRRSRSLRPCRLNEPAPDLRALGLLAATT